MSGGAFATRLETLLAAILVQDGTRLPGSRRLTQREQAQTAGITLSSTLYDELMAVAQGA